MIKIKPIKYHDVFEFVDEEEDLILSDDQKYQFPTYGLYFGLYENEKITSVMVFNKIQDYIYVLRYYNGNKGKTSYQKELFDYFLKVWRPICVYINAYITCINMETLHDMGFKSIHTGFKPENDIKAYNYGLYLQENFSNCEYKEPLPVNILDKEYILSIGERYFNYFPVSILVYDNRSKIYI